MRLPGRERAIVDREKLWNYLLSPEHPSGKHKACFFESLGFDRMNCPLLESALRWHAGQEVAQTLQSIHGRKFVIRASLMGPSRRMARVTSVWIIRRGE